LCIYSSSLETTKKDFLFKYNTLPAKFSPFKKIVQHIINTKAHGKRDEHRLFHFIYLAKYSVRF